MFFSLKVTLEAFHTVEFNYNGKQSLAHIHYTVADNKREKSVAQYSKNNTGVKKDRICDNIQHVASILHIATCSKQWRGFVKPDLKSEKD